MICKSRDLNSKTVNPQGSVVVVQMILKLLFDIKYFLKNWN